MTTYVAAAGGGDASWDDAMSAHEGSGTFGEALMVLLAIAAGKYEHDRAADPPTVKAYKPDGLTIAKQFTAAVVSGVETRTPV